MNEVMGEDVAREEIARWAAALSCEKFEPSNKLVYAVQQGRVSFDEKARRFSVKLLVPIELENGGTIDTLTMREPAVQEVRTASRGAGDDFETTLRLLGVVTEQPVGVLDRLRQRDIILISEVFGFFG